MIKASDYLMPDEQREEVISKIALVTRRLMGKFRYGLMVDETQPEYLEIKIIIYKEGENRND